MGIRTLSFDRLSTDQIAAWSNILRAHPVFSSPFFRPEFTQAVASVRAGVEVAVLEEGGEPIGFFPFQRTRFAAGKPVGGCLSDFHALIAPPDVPCEPRELIEACKLSSWRFDHLVPVHAPFGRFAWSSAESPYIDLPHGFEAYLAQRPNGGHLFSKCRRKRERLEREVGPVRFEPHVTDPAILATAIRWKADQYRRTGVYNIFQRPWVVNLLSRILAHESADFTAVMSVLYAGRHVAAIHFGMRSGPVLNMWFPTYDVALARYSPGLLSFIETIRTFASLGVTRIDLGKGEEPFKKRIMSGAVTVAQGCVDVRPSMTLARRAWRRTRESIKSSVLYVPARTVARGIRPVLDCLSQGD